MKFLGSGLARKIIRDSGYRLKADHVIDATKKHQFLFVQSVKSGSLVGGSLTLRGAPLVIYFTNRPSRIAGQME